MAMQNNIDILGRPRRWNMLEPEALFTPNKIDHQRPIKIAVAISPHDGDMCGNGTQFIQNSLRANISQMPNLIRAGSKIDEGYRYFVVRISKNEYPEHFRWNNGAMPNPSPILHHSNTRLLLPMLALASTRVL